MKPLTRYELLEDANRHPPYAGMRPSDDGEWYAKDEADARFAELEAERDALRVECDGWARERDEAVAERDAALAILNSGHMQHVLRFVMNHAGKGLYGALQDSASWIEKQIEGVRK